MGRAIGAIDVTPIAIAADQRLNAAIWRSAQKQPGPRQAIMLATAALAWTRAAMAAKTPPQSCLCTVCGTAPKQNWPVMDRRRACQSWQVLAHSLQIPRSQSGPGPPTQGWDCPGGSTGTSRPVASLRAKGAPRRGRVPPMDYLDNSSRRSETPPSDRTSANRCGFWPAFTRHAASAATDHRGAELEAI